MCITRIFHTFLLCISFPALWAQVPEPFRSGNKWGYRLNGEAIIPPQYDTAFPFDRTGSLAMVANRHPKRTEVHPLTGEEKQAMDYYFVDRHNTKLSLKPEQKADSVWTFPAQQELQLNYLSGSPVFKILYKRKVWLFNKQGRQLSQGYDDLYQAGRGERFFITETYSEWEGDIVRIKGLVDTSGKVIVNCEKKQIRINAEDSLIYACSAIFNRRLSDDVFDYNGRLIYSNSHHIEFAAKDLFIYRLYEPKEVFMAANRAGKDLYGIEGQRFYDLKHRKALIVDKENWFLMNLQTGKKQKINKEAFLALIYHFIE